MGPVRSLIELEIIKPDQMRGYDPVTSVKKKNVWLKCGDAQVSHTKGNFSITGICYSGPFVSTQRCAPVTLFVSYNS